MSTAAEYNARREQDGWLHGLYVCGFVPETLRHVAVGSLQFVDALVKWQAENGLIADGHFGPDTTDKMHILGLAKLPAGHISPNFKAKEFYSGTKRDTPPPANLEPDFRLMVRCTEVVRKYIFNDADTEIVSGFRTEKFNTVCGGEKNSFHVKGMASDKRPRVKGAAGDPKEWPAKFDRLVAKGRIPQGGMHAYVEKERPFLHTDHRTYRARW